MKGLTQVLTILEIIFVTLLFALPGVTQQITGVPGTFGGVIPTPALDRIAKAGLRNNKASE
jgi:hypothetical protein